MPCASRIIPPILACVAIAAGCGDSGSDSRRATTIDAPPAPAAPTVATAPDPCAAPAVTAPAGTAADPAATRRLVDRAAAARTRSGGAFSTRLRITSPPLEATGTLRGSRDADGDSRARLTWHGAAALLLADQQLAIVDDQLRVRAEGAADWTALGSASGIALDVGRELLDHPFLLRTGAARADAAVRTLRLTVDPAALRDYATTERRGPATELLAHTRSLRLDATVDGDRFVRDHFLLSTTVPDAAPWPQAFAGRDVTISGETVRCR